MKYDLSTLKLLIEDFRTLLNQEREYKKTHPDYGSSGPHFFQYDGTPQDYIKKNNEAISPVNRIRLQRFRNNLADEAQQRTQPYIDYMNSVADKHIGRLNNRRAQNLTPEQRERITQKWTNYKNKIPNIIGSIRSGATEINTPGRASPIGNAVALNMSQIKTPEHLEATKKHEGEHIEQFNTAKQLYGKQGPIQFMKGYITPEQATGSLIKYHTAPGEYYANQAIWEPVDPKIREQIVRQAVEGDNYTGPRITISRKQSKNQLKRFKREIPM